MSSCVIQNALALCSCKTFKFSTWRQPCFAWLTDSFILHFCWPPLSFEENQFKSWHLLLAVIFLQRSITWQILHILSNLKCKKTFYEERSGVDVQLSLLDDFLEILVAQLWSLWLKPVFNSLNFFLASKKQLLMTAEQQNSSTSPVCNQEVMGSNPNATGLFSFFFISISIPSYLYHSGVPWNRFLAKLQPYLFSVKMDA